MEILKLTTNVEYEAAFAIMRQLRPHLDFTTYLNLVREAERADGYETHAVIEDGKFLALMGSRTLVDLVHGKHLYIDDLVVDEEARSRGIGAKLLAFATELGRAKHCQLLRLSTGVDNKDGMRFYEREGWNLRSVTYKKKL